jgi:hypothetical protein
MRASPHVLHASCAPPPPSTAPSTGPTTARAPYLLPQHVPAPTPSFPAQPQGCTPFLTPPPLTARFLVRRDCVARLCGEVSLQVGVMRDLVWFWCGVCPFSHGLQPRPVQCGASVPGGVAEPRQHGAQPTPWGLLHPHLRLRRHRLGCLLGIGAGCAGRCHVLDLPTDVAARGQRQVREGGWEGGWRWVGGRGVDWSWMGVEWRCGRGRGVEAARGKGGWRWRWRWRC